MLQGSAVFGAWSPRVMVGSGNSAPPDNALCGAVQTRCPHTLLISPAAILDIPVYKSRIHPLHVLFSLFLEFKNSQVCSSTQVLLTQLAALCSWSLHIWLCDGNGSVHRTGGPQRTCSQLLLSLMPLPDTGSWAVLWAEVPCCSTGQHKPECISLGWLLGTQLMQSSCGRHMQMHVCALSSGSQILHEHVLFPAALQAPG